MNGTNLKPLIVTGSIARKLINVGPTKYWELVREKKIELVEVGKRQMPTFRSLEKLANPSAT